MLLGCKWRALVLAQWLAVWDSRRVNESGVQLVWAVRIEYVKGSGNRASAPKGAFLGEQKVEWALTPGVGTC